jgi:RNA polymerase sigma-70 factor (ECF subfamily)
MTGGGPASKDSAERLIELARGGSREALRQLMETCRRSLLLVTNQELGSDLQDKLGPSDVLQETLLEAERDFSQFRGNAEAELLTWFRRILLHNLANEARRYRETGRRQVSLDVPLEEVGRYQNLAADSSSPSEHARNREQAEATELAVQRLPEQYRHVILLRERDGHSFAEIGQLMSRSADAARMLWFRAVEHLARELRLPHER